MNTVKPACVVKPRNTDDVKQLVNLANETLTPLVSVSSGPPHFRGDTVPGTGGAVIVDLSGMKKIVRVNRYHSTNKAPVPYSLLYKSRGSIKFLNIPELHKLSNSPNLLL